MVGADHGIGVATMKGHPMVDSIVAFTLALAVLVIVLRYAR
jgi:hypothetical protein